MPSCCACQLYGSQSGIAPTIRYSTQRSATFLATVGKDSSNRSENISADLVIGPVLDLIDLEPGIRQLNGTFYPRRDGNSIARQAPNAEADEIWDEWELTRVFPITRADILKLGKDPSTVAKLEDDVWGLGDDAFAAIFDVYHQIHCLNSLRKFAYGGYCKLNWEAKLLRTPLTLSTDNQSMARVNVTKQREIHVNHCIDMVLQTLQCSGNVNLMTLHWVETQEYPFPDMSVRLASE